ncbi:SDR family NAD(P)-dependent oxidoreductase [Vagococcus sp.]|uniref:SDR family NAD(P)-dependent oxidoreductase n=1 Tax=Vagococcus sp. TaxID=1933889 RepID=UPI003F95B798
MLKEKVCIVTGAGKGIGAGIAKEIAKADGIVIVATLIAEEGQAVVEEITSRNGNAYFVQLDVSNEENIKAMVNEVIDKYERIDCLINNAGITEFKPMEDVTEEDWYRVMDIDLKGVFQCTKYVSHWMKQQQSGSIINIATNHIFSTLHHAEVYNAAKGGVSAMTRSMALSLGKDNIRVNTICPGFTDTPHHQEWVNHRVGTPKEVKQEIQDLHAINKICKPEDVGHLAVFLASPYSECITGSDIVIDGGLSISLFKSKLLEAKK